MSGEPGGILERCVVVGGAGAVGGMFARLLTSSGAEVCLVDTAEPDPGVAAAARFVRADATEPSAPLLDELAAADLALLAVPEPVALAAVGPVSAALPPGALLADTLSVKGPMAAAVRDVRDDLAVVGLNPMFAPSLGIDGRPVATVVMRAGPRAGTLVQLVEQWGGRVVTMTADEHDRLAAASQALTHAAVLAFGMALADLDVTVAELDRIAPPPHAVLLDLLARIASGAPETYWDVQAANPHAAGAREALATGLRRLSALVEDGDPAAFAATMQRMRDLFGADLDRHHARCARTFQALPCPPPVSRTAER